MKPFDYFKNVYTQNYANFNGRARRAEYWYFTLIFILGYVGLAILGGVIGGILGPESPLAMLAMVPMFAFILGSFIPMLALTVRRLHDSDKSGWFLLLNLIPIVSLYVFYLTIIEGTRGSNNFGSDPKAEGLELEDNLVI